MSAKKKGQRCECTMKERKESDENLREVIQISTETLTLLSNDFNPSSVDYTIWDHEAMKCIDSTKV